MLQAKKSYGQHFLNDANILNAIIDEALVGDSDTVVEIGPGRGSLTFILARRAKRVIAIEADRELADELRPKLPKNVSLITGDALKVEWELEIESDYKIVANIPYSITSPLLRKIYSLNKKPSVAVLLVQLEVARRLTAPAGSSERGLMTLLREAEADCVLVRKVAAGSFAPPPQVESAVIKVTPYEQSLRSTIFWPAVEAAFSHKRQKMSNAIGGLPIAKSRVAELLAAVDISPAVRPSELTFGQWQALSAVLEQEIQGVK